MGRKKGSGTGYSPGIFDNQFLKVVADLNSRGIDAFKNSARMEKILGMNKGTLYKLKNRISGISKNNRNDVIRAMQLYFDVNPYFWNGGECKMYNGGDPVVSDLIDNYKDYKIDLATNDPNNLSEIGILQLEVRKLKEKLEEREEQIRQLNSDLKVKEDKVRSQQDHIVTLKELIDILKKPT